MSEELPPLQKGDLVRISEWYVPEIHEKTPPPSLTHASSSSRARQHHIKSLCDLPRDVLGRVLRVSDNDKYDVEWLVLGGRGLGVKRQCLALTTADAAGWTSARRKRPRTEPTLEVKVSPPKKKKTKKAATASSKKGAPKKAAPTSKKAAPTKKQAAKKQPPPKKEPAKPDLYERHLRELERILTRLEKVDPYGYFFDEEPTDDPTASERPVDSSVTPVVAEGSVPVLPDDKPPAAATTKPAAATTTTKPTPKYTGPPFGWPQIRARLADGRYTVDREHVEEAQRFVRLQAYYRSLPKMPRRKHKHPGKASTDDNPKVACRSGIDWELLSRDIQAMCEWAARRDDADDTEAMDSLTTAAKKVWETARPTLERTGAKHAKELEAADDIHQFATAIEKATNSLAAMQSWRKDAFPERRYERLSNYVVCDGLSPVDEGIAKYELRTNLPDSFVGLSYRYDDTGESEAWMNSVVDETSRAARAALAADGGVIRAQVDATMNNLLIQVQDRVMTDKRILHQPELKSANWMGADQSAAASMNAEELPEVVEQPVWGIDCYTRRNISICLETEFESDVALAFIEKWLLPAINACPEHLAHDIDNAARILEGVSLATDDLEDVPTTDNSDWSQSYLGNALLLKIRTCAPPYLKPAAHTLRRARRTLGMDFFRVHPKGHGSVLLSQKVQPNTLVTFYRGEVYPSWRWAEKMDAIDITQSRKSLKPALPDFYNMALERPQSDPRGYGLLFVDASRKAGHGSSLSHSCDPTCEVRVTALHGELVLAMTTIRELEVGEELTFDYNAVTESVNEYRSAVCLCGYGRCRGSFLHFATADCYQKVLNRNAPIATRFSGIVKGCMKKVMSDDDSKLLQRHGFQTAAFGAISVDRYSHGALHDDIELVPIWLRTFVADTLRYIEYERRALPIALICDHMTATKAMKATSETKEAETKEPTNPQPPFFFFLRTEKKLVNKLMKEKDVAKSLSPVELANERRRVAAEYWRGLPEQEKALWKKKAKTDFDKRKKAWKAKSKKAQAPAKEKKKPTVDLVRSGAISFQDADAEGAAAMEQRIQQLAQALSRIGRVLDRHRESRMVDGDPESGHSVHAPLEVLSDVDVVRWVWSSEDGLVQCLRKALQAAEYTRPALIERIDLTIEKYSRLSSVGTVTDSGDAIAPSQSRKLLKEALLALRADLLSEYSSMSKVVRRYKSSVSRVPDEGFPLEDETEEQDMLAPTKGGDESMLEGTASGSAKENGAVARGGSPKSVAVEGAPTSDSQLPVVSGIMSESLVCDAVEGNVPGDVDVKGVVSISSIGMSPPTPPLGIFAGQSDVVPHGESQPNRVEEECTTGAIEHEPRCAEDMLVDSDTSAPAKTGTESNQTVVLPGGQSTTMCSPGSQLVSSQCADETISRPKVSPASPNDPSPEEMLRRNPWIEHFGKRYTLQTAADVLLMYACTTHFFAVNPYNSLESSPIEVYARELGNNVPKNVVDSEESVEGNSPSGSQPDAVTVQNEETPGRNGSVARCEPDDIVSRVSVQYRGDYVLSQLLQWYNGAIGQKPGLPDMLGCAILPSIKGCWNCELLEKDLKGERATVYQTRIRPRLVEWFGDQHQRGGAWPDDIRRAFASREHLNGACDDAVKLGSPILDFLVSGDESNIHEILETLGSTERLASKAADGMLSSVDKGRPAQAVSNWVQCENPDCLKWRKIPWHVDIDLLPEKFFCKDNAWTQGAATCDAPEDDWDGDDALVGDDGKIEGTPIKSKKAESLSVSDRENFFIGGM